MSWLPRTSRSFRIAAGMAVSASVFAWVLRREAVDVNDIESEDREKNRMDKSESSAPLSSLGLGKVLASWTTNFKPSVAWDNDWDRRNPKNMVKPVKKLENSTDTEDDADHQNRVKQATPTASRHLLLIRHGQYFMDTNNDEDRHLTKLGREQAQLTGKRLKELNFPYTTVISSTMTRAKETADLIQEFLPSVPRKQCDLLREGAPIPPEPPVGHWRPEANQFYKDGARIEAAFRKYFHRADASQEKDSYEVVVCHANVIRFCVCRVLQFPPEAWLRISLQNGSITWVTIRPNGRVSLRTLSDSGHMPPDMLTTT